MAAGVPMTPTDHRLPCVAGSICGEPAHCPPADRPTTVAEAVEVGARAMWKAVVDKGGHGVLWRGDCNFMSAAVLSAVGYDDLLAEVERFPDDRDQYRGQIVRLFRERDDLLAERDALAATVARVEALRKQYAAQARSEGPHDNGWWPKKREFDAWEIAHNLRAALHPEKGTDHE